MRYREMRRGRPRGEREKRTEHWVAAPGFMMHAARHALLFIALLQNMQENGSHCKVQAFLFLPHVFHT